MFEEVEFHHAKILLSQLWPIQYEFFDNIHGQILWSPCEFKKEFSVQYYVWRENEKIIGTTHCYRTGYGRVRVRGTFLDPSCRSKGVGRKLVLRALENYKDCHEAYTFPRMGTESFYQKLGFELKCAPGHSRESRHGYSYAVKRLEQSEFIRR